MNESPKTWGEMTDAEKGAMLLARERGKIIEIKMVGGWGNMTFGQWIDGVEYRIKPEPLVKLVKINVGVSDDDCLDFGRNGNEGNTHRITFTTIDGEPDCRSITMEKL